MGSTDRHEMLVLRYLALGHNTTGDIARAMRADRVSDGNWLTSSTVSKMKARIAGGLQN